MNTEHVGFIGLGAMGAPMTERLLEAGVTVTVYDIDSERVRAAVAHGALAANSPSNVAARSDCLLMMVADEPQLDEVLFGNRGAAESLPSAAGVIVMSTIGPAAVRSVQARLSSSQVRLLDAPVSGGAARARVGDLLIMAAGDRDLLAACRPVLDHLGSVVVDCGDEVGNGQSLKLVNQLLAGVHLAASAEALALARSLSIDPTFALEALQHGAAASFMLGDRGPRMLYPITEVKSALAIFVKDMNLVMEAARSHAFPSPLAAIAQQLYTMAAALGLERLDDSQLIRVYERWHPTG